MSARFLVVSDDPQFGLWLQHRIEASRDDTTVAVIDFETLQKQRTRATRRDGDLLLPVWISPKPTAKIPPVLTGFVGSTYPRNCSRLGHRREW